MSKHAQAHPGTPSAEKDSGRSTLRFIHLELSHWDGLGPSRSLEWRPGLNAVLGDERSGKTTLARALMAALRGLPPGDAALLTEAGDGPLALELAFQYGSEVLSVACDFAAPRVTVLSKPSLNRLLEGSSWADVLPALERHTRLSGLARTWGLSLEPPSFTLPPAVHEILNTLYATEIQSPAEITRERTRAQYVQADLVRDRTAILNLRERLSAIGQKAQERFPRFHGQDEGFPIQLLCLSVARGDLRRLREEAAEHQQRVAEARERATRARDALVAAFPAYADLGPDYPQSLARYRELKDVCESRREASTRLQEKVAELTSKLGPTAELFETRPSDFQVRLTAILAMQARAREGLARLEADARAMGELKEQLAATDAKLERLKRYESVSEEYLGQVAELRQARRELAEQRGQFEGVDLEIERLEAERRIHERALEWPSDFQEQLARLRLAQRVAASRGQELERQRESDESRRQERADLQRQLQAFDTLAAEAEDLPQRALALGRLTEAHARETAALAEVQAHIEALEAKLAEQTWRAAMGDDYVEQLQALGRELARLAESRRETEATLTRRQALEAELATLQARVEDSFADLVPAPEDLPDKLRDYVRLGEVQRSLEMQRATLRAHMDEREARIAAEFSDLTELATSTTAGLREWDELHRDLLLEMDAALEDRRQTETALAGVVAELLTLSDVAADHPVQAALRGELEKVHAEHARTLEALDVALAALADGVPTDHEAYMEKVLDWYTRQLTHTASEKDRTELEAARKEAQDLERELQGLAPKGVDLGALRTQQEKVAAAREAVGRHGSRGRTGKLPWGGDPQAEADKRRLAEAEEALQRLLTSWKLPAAQLDALLEGARKLRERLAAANERVSALEGRVSDSGENAALKEEARQLGVSLSEPAGAEVRRLDARHHQTSVLQARRTELASHLEALKALVADVDEGAAARWQKKRDLEAERLRLETRLSCLPPAETLESHRRDLLHKIAGELAGQDEPGARRYLEFQHLNAELARLAEEFSQVGNRSGKHDDIEQIAQKREALARALGPLAEADPDTTLSRFEVFGSVQKQIAEVHSQLSEMPDVGDLRDALAALDREVREGLDRLHVESEAGIADAAAGFHAWKATMAERDSLEASWHARQQPLADMADQIRTLSEGLGRWAADIHTAADGEQLGVRYRLARGLAEALQRVETEAASYALLEQDVRRIETENRSACAALKVPEDDSGDEGLVIAWKHAGAWQHSLSVLRDKRRADASGTPLDALQEKVDELEQSLGILPTEDPELVVQAYRRHRALRERRADLQARLDALLPAPDLETEQRRIAEKVEGALRDLGLPADANPAELLRDFQAFRRTAQEKRQAEKELATLLGGDPPLEKLEEELAELRHRFGDKLKAMDAELASMTEFHQEKARVEALEQACRELEADPRIPTAIQETEALILEKEAAIGDWVVEADADQVLAEYQDFLAARAEADEPNEALRKLPSAADISLRLQSMAQLLTDLDAAAGAHPNLTLLRAPTTRQLSRPQNGGKTGRERCVERASGILSRISDGRYEQLLLVEGSQPRVVADGHEIAVAESGGLRSRSELCWRLAVLLELGSHYPWPIILDEPFHALDPHSRAALRDYLNELAADRQVIVFTADRTLGLEPAIDLTPSKP